MSRCRPLYAQALSALSSPPVFSLQCLPTYLNIERHFLYSQALYYYYAQDMIEKLVHDIILNVEGSFFHPLLTDFAHSPHSLLYAPS
jgi:hypothetical protein